MKNRAGEIKTFNLNVKIPKEWTTLDIIPKNLILNNLSKNQGHNLSLKLRKVKTKKKLNKE